MRPAGVNIQLSTHHFSSFISSSSSLFTLSFSSSIFRLLFFLLFFLLGSWNVAESYQISCLLQILIVQPLESSQFSCGIDQSSGRLLICFSSETKTASIQPSKWAKRYVHSKRKLLVFQIFGFSNKYAGRMARLLLRHFMTSAWLLLRNHVTFMFLYVYFVLSFTVESDEIKGSEQLEARVGNWRPQNPNCRTLQATQR